MRHKYVDLRLCPHLDDGSFERMVRKAVELGYHTVATPLLQSTPEEKIQELKRICKELSVDLASRIDLKPRSPKELLKTLRRVRRKFEIISVFCGSGQVARQAAKDRRVDLLRFPVDRTRRRLFRKAEAELASKAPKSVEIDTSALLTMTDSQRMILLAGLRRTVALAERHRIPIVLSSGATDETLIREPRQVVALATLFDLDQKRAVEAVSANPRMIVNRNREKLSDKFVAPGIRVVRWGKDC